MFFEYEKGQGGGPVKQVTLNNDRSAIVEFEEERSVDVVLRKAPIKMLGETVDVKAYVPYLDPSEALDSINVDGLPVALGKEIAAMTLEQGKAVKRELKVGDHVRVKRSVKTPRDGWGSDVTHGSVGTVVRFGTNTKGKQAVFVNFRTQTGWSGDPDDMEIVY